jgi:hypothetical protein
MASIMSYTRVTSSVKASFEAGGAVAGTEGVKGSESRNWTHGARQSVDRMDFGISWFEAKPRFGAISSQG